MYAVELEKYIHYHDIVVHKPETSGTRGIFRFMTFVRPPARVLDVGAGGGQATKRLREAGFEVASLDIAPNAKCHELGESYQHCIWEPYPTTGDWVYACDVMEHMPPERLHDALKEAAKAGTKGAFIKVPTNLHSNKDHIYHLSMMTGAEWAELLSKYWGRVSHYEPTNSGKAEFYCIHTS